MRATGPERLRRRAVKRGQSRMRDRGAAPRLGRRATLALVGGGLVWSVSGCLSGPSFPDADVVAGSDGRNVFEPAEFTVAVGDTVIWGFASAGHNVCCRPADNDDADRPPDAEGFASYGPDESPAGTFVPRGGTYEHAFDVRGRYDYVCIPHDDLGMTGTIHVK